MNKKMLEIIKHARQLISTPDAWIRDKRASDDNGKNLSCCDPRATCFCLSGAIIHSNNVLYVEEDDMCADILVAFDKKLREENDFFTVENFNDANETKHEDILIFLDTIIREYEGVLSDEKEKSCDMA